MSLAWVGVSLIYAMGWATGLSEIMHPIFAWIIITAIAIIPGFAYCMLFTGLLLDKRPQFEWQETLPDTTIMIAMYNEEGDIAATIDSIKAQEYPGKVQVILIDDGSTDDTLQTVYVAVNETEHDPEKFDFQILALGENQGKAAALNDGLPHVKTEHFITLDADTRLYKDAIRNIVTNIVHGPENTAAVAGAVLVRNSRESFMGMLQEWDYFHGMAVIKRIQSMLQGTLVAQGAFSIYDTEVINELGGWDTDSVGEDIVLTWGLRAKDYRVGYAENAFSFTSVPETYLAFIKQRIRWSKGLIEAFRKYPSVLKEVKKNSLFVWLNATFPYTDLILGTVFIPGVIAALFFQWYAIAGVMTLLLLPLAIAINALMYYTQTKIFKQYGLEVRTNFLTLILYITLYYVMTVPASIIGYYAELFSLKKGWGTK